MNELSEILKLAGCDDSEELFEMSDSFDIELNEDFVIESGIVGLLEDGVIIEGDEALIELLKEHGITVEETSYIIENTTKVNEDDEMQDLMRQLDTIAKKEPATGNAPTDIRSREDYLAKRKALQKIMMDPATSRDPQLRKEVIVQLAHLDDTAKKHGFELTEEELDEMMLMGLPGDQGSKVMGEDDMAEALDLEDLRKLAATGRPEKDANKPSTTQSEPPPRTSGGKLDLNALRDIVKKEEDLEEAKYHGRKVSLGKPFLTPDGPKKRSVYVKKPNGKVVKVNFGDKNMRIKKSNPARRRSFRARHRCDNPGPRWKARYWACRSW